MLWSSNISESLSLSSWWCRIEWFGGTLRSRGCGDGVRSSSSVGLRNLPLPPNISVIMNFDRGGCNTAIDPRCICIGIPVIPVMSDMELILAVNGLSQPNTFHCSTILEIFMKTLTENLCDKLLLSQLLLSYQKQLFFITFKNSLIH